LRRRGQVSARHVRVINQARLKKIDQERQAGIKACREQQKFPDRIHPLFTLVPGTGDSIPVYPAVIDGHPVCENLQISNRMS
jgi:hypothetical protein